MSEVTAAETAYANAKAAYKTDKTKENKAAMKAAKTAIATAQAAADAAAAKAAAKAAKKSNKKKRKASEAEAPPAKKAKLTPEELKAAMKAAKAAYKADKSEANKAALAAAKEAYKGASTEEPAAEPVAAAPAPTVEELKAAMKAAKKAHKADKTNAALKQAYADAKAAHAAAGAAPATPAAAPAAEEAKEEPADDDLASLKKAKPAEESWDNGWKAKKAQPEGGNPPSEKVFVGNLSWDIDDDGIKEFFKDCGTVTDIYWLTDKDTGRFKGCGFVTFQSTEEATKACELNEQELMGRNVGVNFAAGRKDNGGKGGGKGGNKKNPFQNKALSARPDNCTTVFAGNLSFEIDEDAMKKFAEEAGEIKAIRWLSDRDTGDFKGCGFVEFYDAESVDKFVLKNGQDLLGRSIRLDYSAPRAPRENAW